MSGSLRQGRRDLERELARVTERLSDREELVEVLTQQLRSVTQAVRDGVLGVDRAFRCVFVNPAAMRLLGREPRDLLARNAHEVLRHAGRDGRPCEEETCVLLRALRTGRAVRSTIDGRETFSRRDDSRFAVAYSLDPIVAQGRIQGGVLVFAEVAEHRDPRPLELLSTALRLTLRGSRE